MFTQLPKDPMILLSVVNTKLRDHYQTLDALCDDLHIKKADIITSLSNIDYKYDAVRNQFV